MTKTISAWIITPIFKYDIEVQLPSKRIVCPRCKGEGTHVNPNVDGHGISSEDFDADPDFRENYFNGVYDVSCEECKGNKVVDEIDDEYLEKYKPKLYKAWLAACEQQRRDELESYYERKWGA